MIGTMSKMLLVIVMATTMSLSRTHVVGADPNPVPDVRDQAEQILKESAVKIMRALKLILHAVPQYEMPEVLDNGDIIIRRQHPDHLRNLRPSPWPRDGTNKTAS